MIRKPPTPARAIPRRARLASSALPRPLRAISRRRAGLVALWLGLAVLVVPSAGALWSVARPSDQVTVVPATVGFAVDYDGRADAATDPADSVGFDVGPAEAEALMASPDQAIALPFDVVATAVGPYGLSYDVAAPQFAAGSFLARSTVVVFPVGSAGCTPAAGDDPPSPATDAAGRVIALAPPDAPYPPGTTVTQPWCLVLRYAPNVADTTVTVTGQNALGSDLAPATADWAFNLDPDPAAQPPATVALTHYLDRSDTVA